MSVDEGQGMIQWFMCVAMQWHWAGGQWGMRITMSVFNPNNYPEPKLYEYRRELLRYFGWIS